MTRLHSQLVQTGIRPRVTFVAGEYKAFNAALLKQHRFLQFHLRHVEMFPEALVDDFITDGDSE